MSKFIRSGFVYLMLLHLGALAGLALPPLSWWWMLFPSFSLLHVLLHGPTALSRLQIFWRGLVFAFGYFVVAFHWIGYAFTVDAATYLWMMPFAVGGLSLFMASYWAIGLVVVSMIPERIIPKLARIPVAIAVVEWLRGHLLTGFPWSAPGLVAESMGGFAQLASLIGMTGLTALLVALAVLPAQIFMARKRGWRIVAPPLLILLILPLGWAWGNHRVAQNPTQYVAATVVRLVQPNIAQSDKWRSANAAAIFDRLLELTRQPSTAKIPPRIIVWPESAIPFLLDENAEALQRIAEALGPDRILLTGAIRRQLGAAGDPPYFTSILMIDGKGLVRSVYDKWRLVPGGEFLPFETLLSRLGFRKVVSLPESFTAGQGPAAFTILGAGRAALLICYEAIFPHELVPEERPNWMVNVTNDGWFGNSAGPYQHFAQVRLRAIEQGLPIARSANTGISAMIDPVGRILDASSIDEMTVLDQPLPNPLVTAPLYARWGDFALALVLILLAIGFHLCPKSRENEMSL